MPHVKCVNVDDWLSYIGTLHKKAIDLGLQRIQDVASDMRLLDFACPVITVAGTNGKGSVVCLLQHIYQAQGLKVASYTSPHLHSFNERIQLSGVPITDEALLDAFAAVELGRANRPITFFEFTTLAALYYFHRNSPDVVLLEVGLGGRLDAVNMIDADVAVITSISLDHMDYLGPDRASIAYEKAGVFKSNKIAIVGEPDPPQSIFNVIDDVGCKLIKINNDFSYKCNANSWDYSGVNLSIKGLCKPRLHMNSAATSLAVIDALAQQLPVYRLAIEQGLQQADLRGRYERYSTPISIIFDVAHNPAAVSELAIRIGSDPHRKSQLVAVVGMLADKLIAESLRLLCPLVDVWMVASLDEPRGASAGLICDKLKTCDAKSCYNFESVAAAMQHAIEHVYASQDCELLVFGSFHTVAAAQRYLQLHKET